MVEYTVAMKSFLNFFVISVFSFKPRIFTTSLLKLFGSFIHAGHGSLALRVTSTTGLDWGECEGLDCLEIYKYIKYYISTQ